MDDWSYLSDMATCSSIEEPVLVFQFPEIEVRLFGENIFMWKSHNLGKWLFQFRACNSHVGFVIVTDLLDAHVILGVDERLRRGVGLGQGHYAGNVLEVILAVHFNLRRDGGRNMQAGPDNRNNNMNQPATFPIPEWACPIFTTTGNRGEEIYERKIAN